MNEADKWQWARSGYDERVHAFPAGERPASFVEAACSHTVPFGKVVRTHEGTRCLACLLIIGDLLATQYESQQEQATPDPEAPGMNPART